MSKQVNRSQYVLDYELLDKPRSDPLISYRPEPRLKIGRQCFLCALAAAVLWFLTIWTSGSLLVPLFGIGAVALSLTSLNLFFNFLGPGVKIEIHPGHIFLGRRKYPWHIIDKVVYSYLTIHDEGGHETYDRIALDFFLKTGKTRHLLFENHTLPFYVDFEEFVTYLVYRGIPVEDENAPVLHAEDPAPQARRDPGMRRMLRDDFNKVLKKAGRDLPSQEVLDALRQGKRDHQRFRLKGKLVSVLLSIVEFPVTLIVKVFALIWTLLIIFVIVYIVRGVTGQFGLAQTAIYVVLTTGGAVALWLVMTRLHDLILVIKRKTEKITTLASGMAETNQPDPGFFNEDFALYLRSFSSEVFQYLEKPVEGYEDDILLQYEATERNFDANMVSAFDGLMPVYALANAHDASAPRTLHTLFTPTEHWIQVACELMLEAKWVIIYLSAITESVLTELWALDKLNAQFRTIVVVGALCPQEQLTTPEIELLKSFPHLMQESDEDTLVEIRELLVNKEPGNN